MAQFLRFSLAENNFLHDGEEHFEALDAGYQCVCVIAREEAVETSSNVLE